MRESRRKARRASAPVDPLTYYQMLLQHLWDNVPEEVGIEDARYVIGKMQDIARMTDAHRRMTMEDVLVLVELPESERQNWPNILMQRKGYPPLSPRLCVDKQSA